MNKNIKTDTRSEMIDSVNNNFKVTKSLVRGFHNSDIKLNPWFISGFVDAEGSFVISIRKSNTHKLGKKVEAIFSIGLHEKDQELLEKIKSYFDDVGSITRHGKNGIQYQIVTLKGLIKIIDHFNKYPLITQKRADLILWMKVIELMKNKEHLTLEGLRKIIAIKASINLGLSEGLKMEFPDIIPVPRPLIEVPKTFDPQWLAGFTSGEGNFMVSARSSIRNRLGSQIGLRFSIGQHTRDEQLMKNLVSFLGCGYYFSRNNKDFGEFIVTKFENIINEIIPFFDKYPIVGIKGLDFKEFKQAAELIKNKAHLTPEGLEKIRLIKVRMNKGRQSEFTDVDNVS